MVAKAVDVVELTGIVQPAVGGTVVYGTSAGHPGDVVLVVKLVVPVNGDIGENLTCFGIDPLVGVVFPVVGIIDTAVGFLETVVEGQSSLKGEPFEQKSQILFQRKVGIKTVTGGIAHTVHAEVFHRVGGSL